MITPRLKDNSIKGLILFILFSIMGLKSCAVNAQSHLQVCIGGELSLSVPQYTLESDIPALDGLHANYLGTNVGGVIGNSIGKIKGIAGLYYAGTSVPYEIDMMQASISVSAYVLRLREVSNHTFEPYVTVGLSCQGTKFYGYYLPASENGASIQNTNYSVSGQPLLGRANFTLVNIAAGIEYQLENNGGRFIHLFAELGRAALVHAKSFRREFNATTIDNPSTITAGIHFGFLK